ncbi:hypothetical protein GOBAR_DD30379 [Gossypium barbadense]|nr:hypothetical protein GOBAR_DD30379 [Gossypium barbadense]
MAGLTLGLMSLGLVDLEVLIKSGRPQDRVHAAKIFPVVKNQHLLLCTLLIGNSLAMEALPIFLDKLVPPWAAILVSVTLILMFGEILPQAVCTRYGLKVGAAMAPFVRVLLCLFLPISYPISKVLDWMLGKGHAALLRRAELKTFVDFHGNEVSDSTWNVEGFKFRSLGPCHIRVRHCGLHLMAGKGGDLTHDETTIIAGALEMTEKTAKVAMTPISNAFSLDLDTTLDLWVKNLLTIDSEGPVPLRKIIIRKIPRVSVDMPLYDILNEFQKGHSHIAVVYKDLNKSKERLEFKDSCKKRRGEPEMSRKDDRKIGVSAQKSGLNLDSQDVRTPAANNDGGQLTKNSPPATPAFKKRHRGCSYCILDIENCPIPEFPSNEEVVGVITMEDVIEELLQEEILDETDEYVNIHNRIKINMHAPYENASIPTSASPSPLTAPGPTPTLSVSTSTSNTGSPATTLFPI